VNILSQLTENKYLLPVSNLIDIRTATFFRRLTLVQIKIVFVDYLFAMLNVIWIKKISSYGDDIVSICNLRSVVSDMFSDDIIIYIFMFI